MHLGSITGGGICENLKSFVPQDPDPISCKAPGESHNKARVGGQGAQSTFARWMTIRAEHPVPNVHYQTTWTLCSHPKRVRLK